MTRGKVEKESPPSSHSGKAPMGRRIGIEFKRIDAPTFAPSMRIALEDLKLNELKVAYPGDRRYRLAPKVEVIPLRQLLGRP